MQAGAGPLLGPLFNQHAGATTGCQAMLQTSPSIKCDMLPALARPASPAPADHKHTSSGLVHATIKLQRSPLPITCSFPHTILQHTPPKQAS